MARVIGSGSGVIKGSTNSLRSASAPNKCLRTAAFAAYALITQRIFSQSGGKATDGTSFGTYKPTTLDIRRKRENRSNTAINLVFTGELERSLIVSENNIGFLQGPNNSANNPNGAMKAVMMEGRYGIIFEANETENEAATEAFEQCLKAQLSKYL